MIAVTLSTDWAPFSVIKDTLNILKKSNVPVTIFCTDDLSERLLLPMVKGMDVELAIHPWISKKSSLESTIRNMRKKFPHAIGSRSHRFCSSSPLFRTLEKYEFQYDSSVPILDKQIEPYQQINNITEIPVNWSDDIIIKNKISKNTFKTSLLILNFHPVHIYINSNSEEHYLIAKSSYKEPDALITYRHKEFGIRSIFKEILNTDTKFILMRDLLD